MNRTDWIDSCKGIVILLMVIGHVPHLPSLAIKLIYGFHMPFFFIMSGYLFYSEKWHALGFKQFALTRLKNYLIPFAIWSTLNWLIASSWFASSHSIGDSVEKSLFWLYGNLYADGRMAHMPYDTPLWFLPCLFVASILFYLITGLKKKSLVVSSVGLLFLGSLLLSYFKVPQLPWHINGMGYYCLLMWGGQLFKKYSVLDKMNPFITFAFIIVGICAIVINGNVDLNLCVISNPILFLIGSIPVSLACMFLCKTKISNKFFSMFGIGKNSMVVLAFNVLIIEIMGMILPYDSTNYYFFIIVNTIVSISVSMLLIKGMELMRTKSKMRIFQYI